MSPAEERIRDASYDTTWQDNLFLFAAPVVLLVPIVAGLITALVAGSTDLLLACFFLLVCYIGAFSANVMTAWLMPVRVTLNESRMTWRNHFGRTRSIEWLEICARREFSGPTQLYGLKRRFLVWLVTHRGVEVCLVDDQPAFDQVYEAVLAKTPHAVVTGDTRTRWRRWFGIPG